jgi:hypothetical protein
MHLRSRPMFRNNDSQVHTIKQGINLSNKLLITSMESRSQDSEKQYLHHDLW